MTVRPVSAEFRAVSYLFTPICLYCVTEMATGTDSICANYGPSRRAHAVKVGEDTSAQKPTTNNDRVKFDRTDTP